MDLIRRWGTTGWRLVGIIVAAVLVYMLLVAFSGLVVPLVLAMVLGILGVPIVDRLQQFQIPRSIGALIVIAGVIGVFLVAAAIVTRAVISETTAIQTTVTEGADDIQDWLAQRDIDIDDGTQTVSSGIQQGQPMLAGVASFATSVFSSVMAFVLGSFIAVFMLFYVLVDWLTIRTWLAAHLAVPGELGERIVQDATDVVRRGFTALTLTSVVTSLLIGLSMVALGVPLAGAVTVVTFITSYIPYLGAIISGAFGFLIALGASGPRDALILLIVILVVQNIVQTIVGNRLTSDRLKLHPLPSIISSICGIAIAGLLGAMLSAPALALGLAVHRRLADARADSALGLEPTET